MALDFPSSPSLNDTYTLGSRTWKYNGTAWQLDTATLSSADNVNGGLAGNLLYQSNVNDTAFISNGTTGQILMSNGSSTPSWVDYDGGIAMAIALG